MHRQETAFFQFFPNLAYNVMRVPVFEAVGIPVFVSFWSGDLIFVENIKNSLGAQFLIRMAQYYCRYRPSAWLSEDRSHFFAYDCERWRDASNAALFRNHRPGRIRESSLKTDYAGAHF
jgi:hypothetical protein